MKLKSKDDQIPWIMDGPKKRIEFQAPERLVELFDSKNKVRSDALIELMICSLKDEIDLASCKPAPSANPHHWPEKDLLLRNAILIKTEILLEHGPMDPEHFDQILRLAFAKENELDPEKEWPDASQS